MASEVSGTSEVFTPGNFWLLIRLRFKIIFYSCIFVCFVVEKTQKIQAFPNL